MKNRKILKRCVASFVFTAFAVFCMVSVCWQTAPGQQRVLGDEGVETPKLPPKPPLPPPPDPPGTLKTTISSGQLSGTLGLLLAGTRIQISTTGNGEPFNGNYSYIRWSDELKNQMPELEDAIIDFPIIYVDKPLPDWLTGSVCVRVNNAHTFIRPGDTLETWAEGGSIHLRLSIESDYPTLRNDGHRDINMSNMSVELLIHPLYRPYTLNGEEVVYNYFELRFRADLRYVQPLPWAGYGSPPASYDPYRVPDGIRSRVFEKIHSILREKLASATSISNGNPFNKALRGLLEFHIPNHGKFIRISAGGNGIDVWYLPSGVVVNGTINKLRRPNVVNRP